MKKKDNKQCLLDTPAGQQSIIKDSYQKVIGQRKNVHIYKSHGILKNNKEKLFQ